MMFLFLRHPRESGDPVLAASAVTRILYSPTLVSWVTAFARMAQKRAAVLLLITALALAWPIASWAQLAGPTPEQDNPAPNDADKTPENWALYGQSTGVLQYHPGFHSPYQGANSLNPGQRGDETVDATLYGGVRLWQGAEFWANPEVDQGFGLSDTLGVAGFPSGEAYKVGAYAPYVRLQRAFFRQTIDLDGETESIDPDLNQLGGMQTADRLVVTLGKFSVVDIFDTNKYAHDQRNDFLNWSVIDLGSFDYAADAWGYTYGGAAEWYQDWWTIRAGLFDLSKVPNSKVLDPDFMRQYQTVLELEERHQLFAQPGKLKLLGFLSQGRMGAYDAAVEDAETADEMPNTALVRQPHTKVGGGMNGEQQLTPDLGAFLRAGYTQGQYEAYEFTDINKTISLGLSLAGNSWDRGDDTVGLAVVGNDASHAAKLYFGAGGDGILVGDGQLPHSGLEQIIETYYSFAANSLAKLTLDYQFIENPGYNRDRGPVSVIGVRAHVQFGVGSNG